MAFIFDSAPGVVGLVVAGDALPFAVSLGGVYGVPAFSEAALSRAILSGFSVRGEGGIGIAETLREKLYVYVFGERAGEARVTGLGFAGLCGAPTNATGFDYVLDYYEAARATTSGVPVRLIFSPATVLFGYMKGFTFALEDPSTGVGTFAFDFKWMPRVL